MRMGQFVSHVALDIAFELLSGESRLGFGNNSQPHINAVRRQVRPAGGFELRLYPNVVLLSQTEWAEKRIALGVLDGGYREITDLPLIVTIERGESHDFP